MRLEDALFRSPVTLTEAAIIERLRRDPDVILDPDVLHSGFVYTEGGRAALARLHRQYFAIGCACGRPMISCTPTWRATAERAARAGLGSRDINGDCCRFLAAVRDEFGDYAGRIFLGGLLGCRGDAYRPEEALTAGEAESFHLPQARALASGGVDFLFAATLPHAAEALGIARAMARSAIPYLISFIVRAGGTLLDGTPIHEAVARIDREVRPAPIAYMVNCVHPRVFREALIHELRQAPDLAGRLVGLQGNTSPRDPSELNNAQDLETEDPDAFAAAMINLHGDHGIRVLGGCCGTDDRHIASIARQVSSVKFPRTRKLPPWAGTAGSSRA